LLFNVLNCILIGMKNSKPFSIKKKKKH